LGVFGIRGDGTAMINVVLNGERRQLNDHTTITDLLVLLGLHQKRVAIEVNKELVPRSQHATYCVKANDTIEIVHAIGGG
jgi:thiamine biosynthesis protein ThiS